MKSNVGMGELFPSLNPLYKTTVVTNEVAIQVLQMVKTLAPIRTGNLRHIGTQLVPLADGKFEITIGGQRAPYAVYTNEPWISPKWHGKKNPNEHWIDDAVELAATFLAQNNNGRIRKDDK